MSATKPIGFIVGAAGNLMVGYAIFSLLSGVGGADCVNGPSCQVDVGTPTLLLPLGIILSMAGIFMAGFLFFSGLFLAIGIGAILAGLLRPIPGMESFGILFGGMFALGGLAPLIGGRVMKRVGARKQAEAMELIRTGVKGIGTITEVRDTGVTINDNPRVRLTMRIEPMDGSAAVERHKTVTVSRVAVPRAGERYPAWFDRNDESKSAFGTDMEANAPAEIKEMFARAQSGGGASTVGDGMVGEMERLTTLWKAGALSDREFADAKARLLGT